MAFRHDDLVGVAGEIAERRRLTERLALVEFTLDEGERLRKLTVNAIRFTTSGDNASLIILSFAFYLLLKPQNHYLQENSFWRLFESELEISEGYERNYIYEQFSSAFRRYGIPLMKSGNTRQFVLTIRNELDRAKEARSIKRQQAMEFFRWYFNLKQITEVNNTLLQRYNQETRRGFNIAEQAIPSLRYECEVIARILRWGEESNILFAQVNWKQLCDRVLHELGADYDLQRVRLLTSQEDLRKLLYLLQNHCTPAQFRDEVKRRVGEVITAPDESRHNAPNFLSRFSAENISFGSYWIGTTPYHVVPVAWLRCDEIARWPWAGTVSLRSGYIGYRSKSHFEVISNGQRLPCRSFIINKERFFIWVGVVTRGIPLKIDGQSVAQAEGMSWDTCLRVIDDGQRGASLAILIKRLQIYSPQLPEVNVNMETSQGIVRRDKLDVNGNLQLFRDVVLPLADFYSVVDVVANVETHSLNREFAPGTAYLFSTQNFEQISSKGTKRHDGRFFWLFCQEEPQYEDKILNVEETNYFAPYRVFRVVWEDASHPFELKVGQFNWKVEQQQYFDLWLMPQAPCLPRPGEYVCSLSAQQYLNLNNLAWGISTNISLTSLEGKNYLRCQWIKEDEVVLDYSIDKVICPNSNPGTFCLTEKFMAELRAASSVQVQYATNFTLRFYLTSSEDGDKVVIAESGITLLPDFKVIMPKLVSSDENLILKFASRSLNLWNSKRHTWDDECDVVISTQTHAAQIGYDENDTIAGVKSQVLNANLRIKGTHGDEGIVVLFRPFVWAVMLWEHPLNENDKAYGDFYQSPNLNFHGLAASAIVFSATPDASIFLSYAGLTIWQGRTGMDGFLVLRDLTILQEHCKRYVTYFEASCGPKKTSIEVLKAPRIISVSSILERTRIELVFIGPSDTKVKATFMQDGEAHSMRLFSCHNCVERVEIDVPKMSARSTQKLEIVFELPGGKGVISASTLSLDSLASRNPDLDVWLAHGVGISSGELLPMISRHLPLDAKG